SPLSIYALNFCWHFTDTALNPPTATVDNNPDATTLSRQHPDSSQPCEEDGPGTLVTSLVNYTAPGNNRHLSY
ncbi:hypothetical protein BT69DRAFT_1351049, partial [Atractiella rhizophila]